MPPPPIEPTPPDTVSLGEARDYLHRNWEKKSGIPCPCCGKNCHLESRALNSTMVQGLELIAGAKPDQIEPEGWVHVPKLIAASEKVHAGFLGGGLAKLRQWGLLDARPGRRDDGSSRVGYYRVTEQGRTFLAEESTVPLRVRSFNNMVFGYDGPKVTIRQVKERGGFKYDDVKGDGAASS